jgi:uncharacterized damage-inducible protein DinB
MMSAMTTKRTDPPQVADERTLLEGFLDFHRDTLALKCEALTDAQLREASVPPSELTLLGLVRHLAEVERGWFRHVLGGEDPEPLYYSEEDPDGEFHGLDEAVTEEALGTWRAEVTHARKLAAGRSLDDIGSRMRRGEREEYSLRWIYIHMIEEYARHNGHADLIRERIDGATGE